MKRIDRYLMGSVLRATLMTLAVVAVLSYVLTFIEEAADAGKGDYTLLDAALVVASMIPRFLYEAFPVASLIGALLALGGLSSSGELVAMRAAGMSIARLMLAVLGVGLLLVLLVIFIGDLAGPPLERWGQDLRLEKMKKQVTFRSRHGFWARDRHAIVNIRRASPEGRLQGVRIYELGAGNRLERMTIARGGRYEGDRWILEKVRQATFGETRLQIRRLPRLDWESVVDPEMLSVALIKPDLVPAWDLWAHMRALEAGGQRSTDYAIAFWSKVATPITTLAMLLLAVPLVTGGARQVNAGQWVLTGALAGAAWYLLTRGFAYGVVVFDLPPASVALFPLAGFLLLMMVMARFRGPARGATKAPRIVE